MVTKHIILVHGRDTKPQYPEHLRLVRRALTAGLRRVDRVAAERFESGEIRFTFAYYGDVVNRLMVEAEPDLKKQMISVGDYWYERNGIYESAIDEVIDRPSDRFTVKDYEEFLDTVDNNVIYKRLAELAVPVLTGIGIGKHLVATLFPDLKAYLTSHAVASEIQERLVVPLRKALLSGDDIALVAHSMGSIVAYDVLWRFSRLTDYREIWHRRVPFLVTLGNPIGMESVRENLYDADEPDSLRYPANIEYWVNINARDDFIAHRTNIVEDFGEMRTRKLIGGMDDAPQVCNFFVDEEGSNPHKLYGYLNHPSVARAIAAWMWQ